MEGTVIFFLVMSNYGFIKGANGQDYFVHASQITNTNHLREDDAVEFEVGERKGKPVAKNVRVISGGAQ
jgi:cold shock CspA family protein